MDAKIFPSKIDAWLLGVFAASSLVALGGTLAMLVQGVEGALWVALPTLVVGVGLPVWLLCATHYRFEGKALVVQGGPFRWRIPVEEIYTVKPTNNPLSSPALSLRRLRIEYGESKTLLISPRDMEAFVEELRVRGGPPLSMAA